MKVVNKTEKEIKIFDLGSNTFRQTLNLIKKFKKLGEIKEVHTFEAQKDIGLTNFKKLKKNYPLIKFTHNNAPVWKSDEDLNFYECKRWKGNYKGGSSLIMHDRAGGYDEAIPMKAINFIKYFEEHSKKNQYNFIKIDIEGAEYEILPELLKSTSINNLNEIACEWHAKMFHDPVKNRRYKSIERDIKKELRAKSIKLSDWF